MRANLKPALGTMVLAGIVFILAAALFHQAGDEIDEASMPSLQAGDPMLVSSETRLTLPAPRRDVFYNAIFERPLFSPDRRPVQTSVPERIMPLVEQATPAPSRSLPDGLRLSGVFGGEGSRTALLALPNSEEAWLRTGDAISGWTIITIDANWVEISLGNQTIRLELFE